MATLEDRRPGRHNAVVASIVLDPHAPAALRAAIGALSGGPALIDAAEQAGAATTALVGGAVRDLLQGRTPVDLDVAVDGPLDPILAALPGEVIERHEAFGTARVALEDGTRIDLARTRSEDYPEPGALPVVSPAPLEIDLHRRDVTLNAIAIELRTGELTAPATALDDLDQVRLRILHPNSFRDDPTRLWRLARYEVRLGADWEEVTWLLGQQAIAEGAPSTVSAERLGAELRLALREPDPFGALAAGARVGIPPQLVLDAERLHQAEQLGAGVPHHELVLAATASEDPVLRAQLGRAEEHRVIDAALLLRGEQGNGRRPGPLPSGAPGSQVGARFRGLPLAAVAAAPDLDVAARWLSTLRHLELQIDGDDLLTAGIPPGPFVGRGLDAARDAVLDGAVDPGDAAAQLSVALAAAC